MFSLLLYENENFVCMGILSVCMSVHHLCAWYIQRLEEGIAFPGTGVTDGYKLSCGCWDSNPSHLEGQYAFNHWAISLAPSLLFLNRLQAQCIQYSLPVLWAQVVVL